MGQFWLMEHSLPKPAINRFLLIWKVNINYFKTKAERPLHALTMGERSSALGVKKVLEWARTGYRWQERHIWWSLTRRRALCRKKADSTSFVSLEQPAPLIPHCPLKRGWQVLYIEGLKSQETLSFPRPPRVGTLVLIFPFHGWWSLVSFESSQISYSSLWEVATATFQWQDSQIPPPSNPGALWRHQSASVLVLFLEKLLEPIVILDGLPLCKVRPKLLPSRNETAIAEVSRERAPHWEYSKGHQLGLHSTDGEP